jgi:NAD(P)H-nitrite reductase large subunit
MHEDDHVCLCFRVSKRKVVGYCRRERPAVASLISQCLSAGTGCGWCVPHLKSLHRQVAEGVAEPDVAMSAEAYAAGRVEHRRAR